MKLRRIIFWVISAHLLALGLLTLLSSRGKKKFEVSRITPVSLVETAAPVPVPPEVEIEAPAEKAPEKKPPSKDRRKKITRRIPAPISYSSRLKKRLRERLSRIKDPSPPSPAAAPASGLKSRGFNYNWYNTYLYNKIYNLWQEPSRAAVKQEEATALVTFRVYRDGHIEAITLKRSSGSKLMDSSVLQAVRVSDPLPPFPESFKRGYHDFELLFKLSQKAE